MQGHLEELCTFSIAVPAGGGCEGAARHEVVCGQDLLASHIQGCIAVLMGMDEGEERGGQ